MALGLISHDGISWELSEKGKKEMVKCRVIRKNSITLASISHCGRAANAG